ncbi:MAG: response regulator [Thermoguttaceae bacterium]
MGTTQKMNATQSVIQTLSNSGEIVLPENFTTEQVESCYLALKNLIDFSRVEVEKFRADLFSADTERIKKRLSNIKQILESCYAQKLVASCVYLLKHLEVRGAQNCLILAEEFISDLLAFSITVQTAEYQANRNAVEVPAQINEVRWQNLIAQLHQSLTEFDDATSLQIIAQIEKIDAKESIETIKSHVMAFDFEKALTVLNEFRRDWSQRAEQGRKPIILTVDDVSQNLIVLKGLLGSQYKFVGVTSGRAALQYLETNIPDAYILDIDMPEMNGFELVEKIRQKRKIAPIIFLTANATPQYVLKAYEMGITDFLVKPCNQQAVLAKLEVLLRNK